MHAAAPTKKTVTSADVVKSLVNSITNDKVTSKALSEYYVKHLASIRKINAEHGAAYANHQNTLRELDDKIAKHTPTLQTLASSGKSFAAKIAGAADSKQTNEGQLAELKKLRAQLAVVPSPLNLVEEAWGNAFDKKCPGIRTSANAATLAQTGTQFGKPVAAAKPLIAPPKTTLVAANVVRVKA